MAPTPTFSNRTSAATASSASQTITAPETSSFTPPIATLRLRGAHQPRRRIQWAEDVIDNEGMGKKSSKVCCIYHAPRAAGESSSSESDSSDSSSSSISSESDYDDSETNENDDSRARMGGNKGKQKRALRHGARHTRLSDGKEHGDNDHECNHHHDDQDPAGGAPHGRRKPKRSRKGQKRVNAYEKIPKRSAGGGQSGTMTMLEKG